MDLLFGRKEFAFNLERIIKNIDNDVDIDEENKNVIAIHSEFGTGKSHFVKEFSKYFKTKHKFIIYNAWKNDYVGNPLGSIASLINDVVKEEAGEIKNIANDILRTSWKLGKKLTPLVITALIRKYIGLDLKEIDIKNEDVDKIIDSFISEEIKNYDEKKNLVSKLKEKLEKLSIRAFQYYNKKFKLILKTLDEVDLKLVNMTSFPYYFWKIQLLEKENIVIEKIDFKNEIFQNQIIIEMEYTKREDYAVENNILIKNIDELFKLCLPPKNSRKNFVIQFTYGLLRDVSINEWDVDSGENIQRWCKEKISFLKFIESGE